MIVAPLNIPTCNDFVASPPSLFLDPPVPIKPSDFASGSILARPTPFISCTNSREEIEEVEVELGISNIIPTEEQYPQSNDRIQSSVSIVSSSSSSSTSMKSVSFSKVHVREHCIIIGDNPSCEMLPLSLGWSHIDEKIYDVNDYERKKQQRRSLNSSVNGSSHQRHKLDLANRLTFSERMNTLKRVSGMNESDIMWLEWNRRSDDNFVFC